MSRQMKSAQVLCCSPVSNKHHFCEKLLWPVFFSLRWKVSVVLWKMEMGLDRTGNETLVCVHPAATNWVSFEHSQNPRPSCQQILGRNSPALQFPWAVGFQDGDSPLLSLVCALARARDSLEWRSLLQTTYCALDTSLKTSNNPALVGSDLRWWCDLFTN